jgi:hypothetical protein
MNQHEFEDLSYLLECELSAVPGHPLLNQRKSKPDLRMESIRWAQTSKIQ